MTDNTLPDDKRVDDKQTYETAVAELEQVLALLESNELPLEQAIKQFETGVALVKHCQGILDNTEQKIKGLIETEYTANDIPM